MMRVITGITFALLLGASAIAFATGSGWISGWVGIAATAAVTLLFIIALPLQWRVSTASVAILALGVVELGGGAGMLSRVVNDARDLPHASGRVSDPTGDTAASLTSDTMRLQIAASANDESYRSGQMAAWRDIAEGTLRLCDDDLISGWHREYTRLLRTEYSIDADNGAACKALDDAHARGYAAEMAHEIAYRYGHGFLERIKARTQNRVAARDISARPHWRQALP